ncbi:hypothetical protein CRENPOLYSF2_1440001 [Crenothrix polyspora]|uniref:Uncharacterized protein n=1 Tax=Crenothrix polyspora TaxID=360316 RepID=A0A1R4H1F4_9GAMM|nr:hypothetical protein CRENPOLYSF2_1440001 [Crenothrix polyspora]
MEQSLAQGKMRAIIVLSSQVHDRISNDKIMYLDKPISANPMFEALDWAKDISEGKKRNKPSHSQRFPSAKSPEPAPSVQNNVTPIIPVPTPQTTPETATHINQQRSKSATDQHQPELAQENVKPAEPTDDHTENALTATAIKQHLSLQIEEDEFSDFIGTVVDIDLDDPAKQRTATYDPDKYYQGYIQRAFNQAITEKNILQITLGWNPLIILPQSNQIWWDADDKLLKAVSDIEINSKTVTVIPLDPNDLDESTVAPEKKQDMDAFLWKLSLWSSRGRYPQTIDIDSPILLKRWPNFTRHIITPHALRIAALLIKEGPDTMIGVANTLSIELRYVSVFVSAASSLGLIRQTPRLNIDEVVPPVSRNKTNPQKRSILTKILNKLLGR